ncbi:hypothetical protein ACFPK9_05840 [Rubritalea spongiae]|uniref:Uncharacterized protein n=1 Tax=Rubritalea spongiae TaxID=430797 RepID=A0ABW5E4H6_9BACT
MTTSNANFASPVAFSVRSQAYGSHSPALLIIGAGSSAITYKAPSAPQSGLWFAVIDRTTLEMPLSIIHADNTTVPSAIQPYLDDKYILVVASVSLSMLDTPQGELFKFLDKYGAGRGLRRMINIATQFGCGSYGFMSYTLVNTLFPPEGQGPAVGFERVDTEMNVSALLTIELRDIDVSEAGKLWTPTSLSD